MPGRRRSTSYIDLVLFALVVGGLAYLTIHGSLRSGYDWQWERVPQYLLTHHEGRWYAGPLLKGLTVTFQLTAVSLLLSFVFGLTTALLRMSGSILGQGLARVYLEAIRNTPLLVQLFFVYFVLAPILGIGRFTAAVLTLSLFEGAYASEILRAGILSIHRGQREAAHSLGLSGYQTYRHVILPQAFRVVLPPLTGQAVSLIKDSALVSTIAIFDLTMRGQAIVAETFLTFEIWFTVAAIYLAINVLFSWITSRLEVRNRPG